MVGPDGDTLLLDDDDDGERVCVDCGESFNVIEGGVDFNVESGGPLCALGQTRWEPGSVLALSLDLPSDGLATAETARWCPGCRTAVPGSPGGQCAEGRA